MLGMKVDLRAVNFVRAIGASSRPVQDARFRSFGHAAASIRKKARASIKTAPKEARKGARRRKGKRIRRATHKPAPEGSPVRTQRGAYRRAIAYHADDQGAIIGPMASVIGTSGQAHEHGGEYKGGTYGQRAVMGPALEESRDRFASGWADSIGA